MALDYGRRRIGVAASDPLRTIASPHVAMKNADPPTEPPQGLLNLLRDLAPVVVIVGVPVHMDGTFGEMATEARAFAARLSALSDLQVLERDERLTSYEAEEMRDGGWDADELHGVLPCFDAPASNEPANDLRAVRIAEPNERASRGGHPAGGVLHQQDRGHAQLLDAAAQLGARIRLGGGEAAGEAV